MRELVARKQPLKHVRLFQYIRLPFGLTNVTVSLQRLLEHVLRDYNGQSAILHIDDILI